MPWLASLIAKHGLIRVIGAGVLLLAVLWFAGVLGLTKFKAWYYEGKADRLAVKLETSRAETKVARKDEKQVERAGEITADTIAAQDNRAAATEAATTKTVEVIRERIKIQPVVIPAPDDPIVRDAVAQARKRAETAQDRLRGASGD